MGLKTRRRSSKGAAGRPHHGLGHLKAALEGTVARELKLTTG
jgi:hypothetical protein